MLQVKIVETPSETGNMFKSYDIKLQQLDLKLDAEYLLFVLDVLQELTPPGTEEEQRLVGIFIFVHF